MVVGDGTILNNGYVKINSVVLCILRLPNHYVITFDGTLDALIRHFLFISYR